MASDSTATAGRPPCDRPAECRIQQDGPAMATLVYYPPIYDGYGHNLNPDRNRTFVVWRCYTCGATWRELV